MDLIDRQEAIGWIDSWLKITHYYHPHSKSESIPKSELYDILGRIPTVDAEPVIRCKDCKYMGEVSLTHNGDYIVNSCGYHNSFVNKNDFCSRSERKADGT